MIRRFNSRSIHRTTGGMAIFAVLYFLLTGCISASSLFTPEDVLRIKNCTSAVMSPDGQWIAFTQSSCREPGDRPGNAYSNLFLISVKTREIKPFITGKTHVSSVRWSPDSREIAFLMKRGEKGKTQVWSIRVDGGEALPITESKSDVLYFNWHPGGKKIAYIATEPPAPKEETLAEKGYKFIFFEENLRHRNLYMTEKSRLEGRPAPKQLTRDITVWDFQFSPDGRRIAASLSEKNLVDQNYMFRTIHLIDPEEGATVPLTDNPGKLGNYTFSPDGTRLVYTAAQMRKDHAVSGVYVISTGGGKAENLTPSGFRGHVSWAGWKDKDTVLYYSDEGVYPTLSLVSCRGGSRRIILSGRDSGIVFGTPSFTADFRNFSFTGSTPAIPSDVFYWQPGGQPCRLTTVNPWIAGKELGRQEVVTYRARDGWKIEGILVYPVGYRKGERYPLIVSVHGGPEAHYSNRWLTRYFHPAQVLAGRGYAVFHPNYRSSTGYGLQFALAGYEDAAGREFDDLADGIEYLIDTGIADRDRTGLGGASYGGYAAAWFASYYTEYVRATVMFVGISNIISKRSTTDIPFEELYVHSGKMLEEMWDFSLRRSPIYYAHKSRTAVLIAGGANDPRVNPSQSIEFYRCLKMNGHPAVRLVQYPGEGHGNAKQPAVIDILYRHIQWYDWYVRDKKPLNGPMPPLDISDSYGLQDEDRGAAGAGGTPAESASTAVRGK